jgi:hypothetical protein
MDDNKVKEIISEAFFTLILAKNRFNIFKSITSDYGVDLLVNPVLIRTRGKKQTRVDSGKKVDIQLKCTTQDKVEELSNGNIKFLLRVKNYEDLVYRKDEGGTPLMLIVFILPTNESEWIEIFHDQLLLRKCGYWYLMPDKSLAKNTSLLKETSNTAIEINHNNRLTLDFKTLYDSLWA